MNRTDCDRPMKKKAGGLEVTPEMIAKGMKAFERWEKYHYPGDIPPCDYQAEILVKMIARTILRIARNIQKT